MSMHRIPLTTCEEEGLRKHGLNVGTPSQMSDCFRLGVSWGEAQAMLSSPATAPCLDREEVTLLMELMQAALKGEKLVLLGRLSENQLYNRLAVLAGNTGE